jgi:penicillin-binding protein 1A
VVSSGTGENAAGASDYEWGKTGTTEDNGDAWFCGATEDVTSCVWVGHADSVQPMETEYGGAPVDGGTIPALIWFDVISAWESIKAAHQADEDAGDVSSSETSSSSAPSTTYSAPPSTSSTESSSSGSDSSGTSPAPAPAPQSAPAPAPAPAPSGGAAGSRAGRRRSRPSKELSARRRPS